MHEIYPSRNFKRKANPNIFCSWRWGERKGPKCGTLAQRDTRAQKTPKIPLRPIVRACRSANLEKNRMWESSMDILLHSCALSALSLCLGDHDTSCVIYECFLLSSLVKWTPFPLVSPCKGVECVL